MDLLLECEPYQYLFLFFIFCNIGWVQESLIESLYHRRWINRGFLKGPYIPIYGFGGMLLLLCGLPFRWNGFLVYICGAASCTLLEYFVGWLMETFFHKQFWDYSMMKFTYKNRISLLSSMFWGVLSLFMTYVLSEVLMLVLRVMPTPAVLIYDVIMAVAVTLDAAVSVSQYVNFREYLKKFSKEKAKQIIAEKFIRIGGAVMLRRQKLSRYISRLSVPDDDFDELLSGDEPEESEEELLARKDANG